MIEKKLPKVCEIAFTALFLIAATAFAQTDTLPPLGAAPSHTFATSVDVVKNIVNILFFVAVGLIAILSYLQARKTIFTPMKTETFKLQLKLFEDMILFFEEFKQKGVDDVLHLHETLEVNSVLLLDGYVRQFFKSQMEVPAEKRAKLLSKYPKALITPDVIDNWELVDDYVEMDRPVVTPEVDNPAVILAQWQKFKYGPIFYTNEFDEVMAKLDHFRGSPLVPFEIKEMVTEFQQKARDNVLLVGEILTAVAQELPEKYPNPETVKRARFHWIWNKYTDRRSLIEEIPDKVLKHINKYLDVEHILG
ncbi:MAG: hypothetical protein MIO92_16510 [Methanosarcinaceae archaeon]|nr:hypothetical protein [Methanosarcinaceae archaeon]